MFAQTSQTLENKMKKQHKLFVRKIKKIVCTKNRRFAQI